jgi:hypothetical protein
LRSTIPAHSRIGPPSIGWLENGDGVAELAGAGELEIAAAVLDDASVGEAAAEDVPGAATLSEGAVGNGLLDAVDAVDVERQPVATRAAAPATAMTTRRWTARAKGMRDLPEEAVGSSYRATVEQQIARALQKSEYYERNEGLPNCATLRRSCAWSQRRTT